MNGIFIGDKFNNFKGVITMNNMTILTKPINNIIIIDKNKLEEIKKNKINPEFLRKCLDYSGLMK